jgi:hypothetical protein
MAPCSPLGATVGLGKSGLDDDRGCRGPSLGCRSRLGGARRLGALLGGRGSRESDRDLAVHRLADPFGDSRGPRSEGGRDQLLGSGPLRRSGSPTQPAHAEASPDQHPGHGDHRQQPDPDARAECRQTPPGAAPRLRRHPRRGRTEHALRLPCRSGAARPARQHPVRMVVDAWRGDDCCQLPGLPLAARTTEEACSDACCAGDGRESTSRGNHPAR